MLEKNSIKQCFRFCKIACKDVHMYKKMPVWKQKWEEKLLRTKKKNLQVGMEMRQTKLKI